MSAKSGWADARNVLGVRLDNLGDVLMTTPASRAVKQSPAGAQAARLVPEIDDVAECRAPWVAQPEHAEASGPLIEQLAARRFEAAVIFTVYSQSPLPAATVLTAAQVHVICGELDVQRLAALVALAPVLLSNNSGPAHLAAAVGTPVVDVYALTNPQHTPWAVPHRVLFHDMPCRFCYRSVCPEAHHACLTRIAPGDIADAAEALLGARAPAPRSRTIDELLATSSETTAALLT